METTPQQLAEQFINHTKQNVFLTGKAGTGKTTFLKHIIESTHKRVIVTAPTGIAALNAGGVTLHSQFQLPFGGFIPEHRDLLVQQHLKFETKSTLFRHLRMNQVKRKTIIQAELLIIDEVSMLRADILDAVDFVLQSIRRSREPFGGLQVLFIGDLLQLPPVVSQDEWGVMKEWYDTPFFFGARVLRDKPPVYIELDKIYRQSDREFTDILNNLRYNKISDNDVQVLNRYYQNDLQGGMKNGYIMLTTHNRKADEINQNELGKLKTSAFSYDAIIEGNYPENLFPCEKKLTLKEGAQVMFIKNDPSGERRYYNGKIGVVENLRNERITVKLDDGQRVVVEPYEWQHIRYNTNETTREIDEEILGSFTQYPLRLAWAITIHKSQGLTFDKAVLDVRNVFAAGQCYVALSRLRSLDGLILTSRFSKDGIDNDASVTGFEETRDPKDKIVQHLQQSKQEFLKNYALSVYNFSDLVTEWKRHLSSYNKEENRSEKQLHAEWAKEIVQSLEQLQIPSYKFLVQLKQLFSEGEPRYSFIEERLTAARNFYDDPLKGIIAKVFLHIRKMRASSRTKKYVGELEDLDSLLLNRLKDMYKVTLLAKTLTSPEKVSPESWTDTLDMSWREKLMEVQLELPAPKKKKVKGDTVRETYRLYSEGKKIREIAKERNLQESTIEGHFAKLIREDKIDIYDIIGEGRIYEIMEAMKQNEEGEGIGALKTKLGDDFSYGEIRMVWAYTEKNAVFIAG